MQKMMDQEWSDSYVSFTMILCAPKLQETLITLLSEFAWVSNDKDKCLVKPLESPCRYYIHNLPNTKVKAAKNHSKNCMKVKASSSLPFLA